MKTRPKQSGWYSVNFWTCEDYRDDVGPYTKPRVVYYDGNGDYVCYDPLGKGRGGITDANDVAIWGDIVLGKKVPPELRCDENKD